MFRLLAALILSVGMMVSIAPAAWSSCHNTEQGLFRMDTGTQSADGVISTNYLRDRDLNPDCHDDAEAHSTEHVKNSMVTKWAEVGWHEYWRQGAVWYHDFNIFWEVGTGDMIVGHLANGPDIACCQWLKFKVRNIENSNKWEFFYDPGANGNWIQVGPSGGQGATFGTGIPMGETARRGGTATGAADEHKGLLRKTCGSCNYNDWSDNTNFDNDISNWHANRLSDTRYEVVKD